MYSTDLSPCNLTVFFNTVHKAELVSPSQNATYMGETVCKVRAIDFIFQKGKEVSLMSSCERLALN